MVNGRVERKNARRINGDKEEPEKPRIGVKKNRKKTLANDTYTLTARCRSATYSPAKRLRLIKLLGNKRIKEKKKIVENANNYIYIRVYFLCTLCSVLSLYFLRSCFLSSISPLCGAFICRQIRKDTR